MAENSGDTQLAVRPDQMGAIEVRQQVNQIQYLMQQVLRQGEHFGNVPGTKGKPTLFQSGAEKIAYMFHLVPSYEVKRTDYEGGHREYEVTCTLTSRDTGEVMGYGIGTCSTLESKYRYRNKWVNGQKVREENVDVADVWNTVMKMAKKRAFVDAVKSTTAASDIFTQDVEDLPDYMLQPSQPVQATVQSVEPAPKPKPTLPEEDRAALAEMADELEGWGVQNAKRQLWVAYNEGGIEGARDAYGSLLPKSDGQPDELADADYYDVDQAF